MTDYEKLLAVDEWARKNITYQDSAYDYENRRFIPAPIDAVGVLESGFTICAGYSNLTAALLRSIGIST